jgi:hypothetical protein
MNRTDLIREISKANSVGNPVVDARIADQTTDRQIRRTVQSLDRD